jgi:hypothetical protein
MAKAGGRYGARQGRLRRVMLRAVAAVVGPAAAGLAAILGSAGLAALGPAASAGVAPAAAPAPTWEEVQHAAKLAHDRRDFPAFREDCRRLLVLISGHPDAVLAMGKAEALLGNTTAAMEWLNRFAGMGLTRDLAAEADLAALKPTGAMADLVARIAANGKPVSRAARVFTLADPELLTEDIAYDAGRRRFLISSIRQAKIVAVDASTGATADFVPAGRDAIWGVLALAVDARRGVLWATTAAMAQTRGYRAADAGHTAVLRYDLATGVLQQRYDLPLQARPASSAASGATANVERVLGDMTVGPNGDVYASEGEAGAVYLIRHDRDALETLVPEGTFASPQTPAVTPDGRRLLVADYVRGIGVVDLTTRAVTWMPHPYDVAVSGIDGLYWFGASLVAVQNGTEPNRVIRLDLDPSLGRIVGWKPLESNSAGLGVPTHGTLVGNSFYFLANSGWNQLADDGSLKPGGKLTSAAVLRITL